MTWLAVVGVVDLGDGSADKPWDVSMSQASGLAAVWPVNSLGLALCCLCCEQRGRSVAVSAGPVPHFFLHLVVCMAVQLSVKFWLFARPWDQRGPDPLLLAKGE